MKRTSSRILLGFLLIVGVSALPPSMNLAQVCAVADSKPSHICATPGAQCSPVTDGTGSIGLCTTENLSGGLRCECKGLPPHSYTMAVTPLAPNSITAPAGGTATSTITVTPFNGFTGPVSFTCSVTGGQPPIPTCPNPAPVNVVNAPATSALSVTTDKLTSSATYTVTVTATDASGTPPNGGPKSLSLTVSHQYGVGGGGGGGIAILTLAALLALWSMGRLVLSKRVNFR
jgi:hypothetical protein